MGKVSSPVPHQSTPELDLERMAGSFLGAKRWIISDPVVVWITLRIRIHWKGMLRSQRWRVGTPRGLVGPRHAEEISSLLF